MLVPFELKARPQPSPPVLVSVAIRAVVALTVVCATAASVWLGDTISSTVPPAIARASHTTPEPLLVTLPTVVIIGRRDALGERESAALPGGSAEVSSVDPQDLSPGRVKFRQ